MTDPVCRCPHCGTEHMPPATLADLAAAILATPADSRLGPASTRLLAIARADLAGDREAIALVAPGILEAHDRAHPSAEIGAVVEMAGAVTDELRRRQQEVSRR